MGLTLKEYIEAAFASASQETKDEMLKKCCAKTSVHEDTDFNSLPFWTRVGIVDIITAP